MDTVYVIVAIIGGIVGALVGIRALVPWLIKPAIDRFRRTRGLRTYSDGDMVRAFYGCFDRPAFRDPFLHESDLDALMTALDDTIAAINTGVKKTRDGVTFGDPVAGKAYFDSDVLRQAFDEIVRLLSEARRVYAEAREAGYFFDLGGSRLAFHSGHDREATRVAVRIDELRNEALRIANGVYDAIGMRPFPYIETPSSYLERS